MYISATDMPSAMHLDLVRLRIDISAAATCICDSMDYLINLGILRTTLETEEIELNWSSNISTLGCPVPTKVLWLEREKMVGLKLVYEVCLSRVTSMRQGV